MKTAKWSGVAGLSMLVACGGGDTKRGEPGSADTPDTPAREGDVAGGETSEFSSGDQDICPEIASDTPLDLAEADIAAWVALTQGHHDIGFHWKNNFQTDSISGFEEHTQLSLDVTALRARELVYGTAGYDDPPELVRACGGTTARQLELEVSARTSDGALRASFRHWVAGHPDPTSAGRIIVSSALVYERNDNYDAESFTSAIDFGLDPALGGKQQLGVIFQFDSESVSGALAPYVWLPASGSRDYDATWAPLLGIFPDDACGPYHRPVDLDEERSELGTTPRAAFESSLLRRGMPMAAAWEDPDPTLNGEAAVIGRTQVNVTAGAPTHACQDTDRIQIHAPITVETADGKLRMTQPGSLSSRLNGGDYVNVDSVWIPANDFESATGMSLGSGEYGAVELSYWQASDGSIEGNLSVHVWQDFEQAYFARPGLHW